MSGLCARSFVHLFPAILEGRWNRSHFVDEEIELRWLNNMPITANELQSWDMKSGMWKLRAWAFNQTPHRFTTEKIYERVFKNNMSSLVPHWM